ncbi:MAG: DUF5680 domain-containing protein [Patescibacteria group bacterium]
MMCEVHKPERTTAVLREFFFECMRRGYVFSPPPIPMVGLPGSKSIRYEQGDLLFVDFWLTTPSSKESHGMTLISRAGRPVWAMHYGGWYDKRVIPFLKRALARNYDDHVFEGGRGPRNLEGADHTLQYLNKVEQEGFADFRGHEQIIATSHQTGAPVGTVLGEHRYFGGLMV